MDCPKRKALNALLKTEEAKDPVKRSLKSLTMGALRLLNVVQKQPASPKRATDGSNVRGYEHKRPAG